MTMDAKNAANPSHFFKYYDLFGMLSVCILMISNTVAPKLFSIGPITTSVAILVFPITYIASDILTEVYGYARARRVTWASVAAVAIMCVFYQAAIAMPHIPQWENQEAFERTFAMAPRMALASVTAILVGEMLNAFVLAKMKVKTQGRNMWMRLVGSTFVGQGADSVIVAIVAFAGIMPWSVIISVILTGWFGKTAYEIIMLPLTTCIVKKLKRAEGVDFFDTNTDFTPFTLDIEADKK